MATRGHIGGESTLEIAVLDLRELLEIGLSQAHFEPATNPEQTERDRDLDAEEDQSERSQHEHAQRALLHGPQVTAEVEHRAQHERLNDSTGGGQYKPASNQERHTKRILTQPAQERTTRVHLPRGERDCE